MHIRLVLLQFYSPGKKKKKLLQFCFILFYLESAFTKLKYKIDRHLYF